VNNDKVIHVEGHSDLVRCAKSGAVLNIADDEYRKFVFKKEKEKETNAKIKHIEDELHEIRDMLALLIKHFPKQ